ncbi:hypothetical protein SAMD00019534_004240 [Acytostelium subglobosum LB1]|uniref:hypothetical protein n=1 Tax=Acytostelium subglobosum LB1 TaxID=1410327 RepID=UPI000644911A|nr:hypothetical protein SAMD00019534_004240 [Acytostelium subglobosum LB1]GAM17249.1 hypothetical protein SAMD00019534_004240 [Acytostelium subglobosum LB1]|eukprot:XP_012759311.1 hypothetical protein SAMD00019534_004240 [Acytostelium subglobosum LB1]
MLCEISVWGNFMATWTLLSVAGLFFILLLSGIVFVKYYVKPTYEMWRWKTNPKYPSAEKVKDEIIMMLKGMVTATFCPALALQLAQRGASKAYCGVGEFGWGYLIASFFIVWIASDFYEFFYHRLGHKYDFFWNIHRYHHQFYNPSPFAVIADEYVDQLVRSAPLLLFPMIAPINMDMMFLQYAIFFYGYGSYLHWGYEFSWPDAHHPVINTAFQHYLHHAISIKNRPYHTGFFFKLWDQLFGSVYTEACFCAKCEQAKGERSVEKWKKVEKPDYSVLLRPAFWFSPSTGKKDE